MTTTKKPKNCPQWANFQPSRTSYFWTLMISLSAAIVSRCNSSAITRIRSAASGTPRLYPTNKSGCGKIPEYCWCWNWTTGAGAMLVGGCCLFCRFGFVNSYLAFVLRHCFSETFANTNPNIFTQPKSFPQLLVIRLHLFTRPDFGTLRKWAGKIPHRTETAPKRLKFIHIPHFTNLSLFGQERSTPCKT